MTGTADISSTMLSHAEAVAAVEEWLKANAPGRPLNAKELKQYRDDKFTSGWRISCCYQDVELELDLLLDGSFPYSLARVAVATPLPFPSYPHVEEDGMLCLVSGLAEPNPLNPVGIVQNVLAWAGAVLEAGISGRNHDDFRSEFLSYWNPGVAKVPVRSILEPCEPSRMIRYWAGEQFYFVGENENAVRRWFQSSGLNISSAPLPTAMLLWLEKAPLPSEYVRTAADIWDLIEGSVPERLNWLKRSALEERRVLVVLGAQTQNGICLSAARFSPPTIKGFRKGRAPLELLDRPYFEKISITRMAVYRADPYWVHGRDRNGDLPALNSARVAMLGCGSLGGSIVHQLAQAGVGELLLVDGDALTWANTGRHQLGAEWVGHNKAVALKTSLQRAFPSIRVAERAIPWQQIEDVSEILNSCDLIISTIGSWGPEAELNAWHVATGRKRPIIYGWTEPHAVAAQAVHIGNEGACFACGVSEFGRPKLCVSIWPAERERVQEPACGAYFQPYGPIALSACVSLVAGLAVDTLLEKSSSGCLHIWAAPTADIKAAGGNTSPEWSSMAGVETGGLFRSLSWSRDDRCSFCS